MRAEEALAAAAGVAARGFAADARGLDAARGFEPPDFAEEPLDFAPEAPEFAEEPLAFAAEELGFAEDARDFVAEAFGFAEEARDLEAEPLDFADEALDLEVEAEDAPDFVADAFGFAVAPLDFEAEPLDFADEALDLEVEAEDARDFVADAFGFAVAPLDFDDEPLDFDAAAEGRGLEVEAEPLDFALLFFAPLFAGLAFAELPRTDDRADFADGDARRDDLDVPEASVASGFAASADARALPSRLLERRTGRARGRLEKTSPLESSAIG